MASSETEMGEIITEALYDSELLQADDIHISTFDENAILTRNKGIVIELADGSEFQVTIVKTK